MAVGRYGRARWAVVGVGVTVLVAGCSVYPVSVEAGGVTGVWSSYGSEATVEFKDDGTFVGTGLDASDVGTRWCSGIAGRQQGKWTPSGEFAEVSFDGVDCEDVDFAFYGSPEHYIACFTRDVTAGCTEEFRREEGRNEGAGKGG